MSRRNRHQAFFFLLGVVVFVTIILEREKFSPAHLQEMVESTGRWGPLVFIASYAFATVFFVPGSLFTLLGGALFGPFLGTVYNVSGATLGSVFSFLMTRYFLSDYVASRATGKIQRIVKSVNTDGWHFVAFVRLVPLFPFNFVNYAFGLTKIKLGQYATTTFIFMIPGAFAYTYLGYAGRGAIQGGQNSIRNLSIAVSLILATMLLPKLIQRLKRPI